MEGHEGRTRGRGDAGEVGGRASLRFARPCCCTGLRPDAVGKNLEYERALGYIERARAIAKERGLVVTVAVHDAAGHPVALARGKSWHGPYMAMGKARLAAAFRKPTKDLLEQWQDRPLFPISLTTMLPGGVTIAAGGCPIVEDGRVVGAIGIGGGKPDQDDAIARLAVGWSDELAKAARDEA